MTNIERAVTRKARQSWQKLSIIAEFIASAERLSGRNERPCDDFRERCDALLKVTLNRG